MSVQMIVMKFRNTSVITLRPEYAVGRPKRNDCPVKSNRFHRIFFFHLKRPKSVIISGPIRSVYFEHRNRNDYGESVMVNRSDNRCLEFDFNKLEDLHS